MPTATVRETAAGLWSGSPRSRDRNTLGSPSRVSRALPDAPGRMSGLSSRRAISSTSSESECRGELHAPWPPFRRRRSPAERVTSSSIQACEGRDDRPAGARHDQLRPASNRRAATLPPRIGSRAPRLPRREPAPRGRGHRGVHVPARSRPVPGRRRRGAASSSTPCRRDRLDEGDSCRQFVSGSGAAGEALRPPAVYWTKLPSRCRGAARGA
jgi:hypothetical protein